MSDNNEPLFQNMDEQERIYAPEQVPGDQIVPEERDRGEGVGETPAQANRDDVPVVGFVPGAAGGGITGASGGTAGAGAPGVLPVLPIADELDPDEERERRREDER